MTEKSVGTKVRTALSKGWEQRRAWKGDSLGCSVHSHPAGSPAPPSQPTAEGSFHSPVDTELKGCRAGYSLQSRTGPGASDQPLAGRGWRSQARQTAFSFPYLNILSLKLF